MGIRGLQTYFDKHCPQALRPVDLQEMVGQYRKTHPNVGQPELVIDGESCIWHWYKGLDFMCSGQWQEFICVLENFVQSLKSLGIKLTFFFDSALPFCLDPHWFEQKKRIVKIGLRIFNPSLKGGKNAVKSKKDIILPASVVKLCPFALKFLFDVQVYMVVHQSYYGVLASYAKKNQCLGILGNNTYLVAYDTVPYLFVQTLNLSTKTTILYDRDILCKNLGLQLWQLPLLAYLFGTEYISKHNMQYFLRYIIHKYHEKSDKQRIIYDVAETFLSVATFIKSFPESSDKENIRSLIPSIISTAFPKKNSQKIVDGFNNAFDKFTTSDTLSSLYVGALAGQGGQEAEKVFADMLHKTVTLEMMPLTLDVLTWGQIERRTSLEDATSRRFPPSMVVYRPIRKFLYKLIFNLRDSHLKDQQMAAVFGVQPSWNPHVKEWWVHGTHMKKNPDSVKPRNLPSGNVPDLLDVWKNFDEKQKYLIFSDCLELSIPFDIFGSVPSKYRSLCALLNYLILCPKVHLKPLEVDALLVQAVLPKGNDVQWLRNLKVRSFNPRAIHLAALFTAGINAVIEAVSVCGNSYKLQDAMPWNFFDGKRFQHCYYLLNQKASLDKLCSGDKEAVALFRQLKKVTMHGVNI